MTHRFNPKSPLQIQPYGIITVAVCDLGSFLSVTHRFTRRPNHIIFKANPQKDKTFIPYSVVVLSSKKGRGQESAVSRRRRRAIRACFHLCVNFEFVS